ncbi:hypothetical protein TNCV_4202241 [Trichonephila clavipes]|nr:hypothetical protein TNCV_4202241 [Trichonephila clavipes]
MFEQRPIDIPGSIGDPIYRVTFEGPRQVDSKSPDPGIISNPECIKDERWNNEETQNEEQFCTAIDERWNARFPGKSKASFQKSVFMHNMPTSQGSFWPCCVLETVVSR